MNSVTVNRDPAKGAVTREQTMSYKPHVNEIKKGDTVILRGFPVLVISIDYATNSALVQFGARMTLVTASDLKVTR